VRGILPTGGRVMLDGKKAHIIQKVFVPVKKQPGLVLLDSWPILEDSFNEPKRINGLLEGARFIHYVYGPASIRREEEAGDDEEEG